MLLASRVAQLIDSIFFCEVLTERFSCLQRVLSRIFPGALVDASD